MPRILLTLATVTLLLLGVTFVVGLMVEVPNLGDVATRGGWMSHHFLLGVASALAVVFVHSLAVTYFIGTTRWCREVSETYGLSPRLTAQGTRLKRRSFPWSLLSMLIIVGTIALGAAADPATGRRNLAPWATAHLVCAAVAVVFMAMSFYIVWTNVGAQQSLIDQILLEVREIRKERGLDTPDNSEIGQTS